MLGLLISTIFSWAQVDSVQIKRITTRQREVLVYTGIGITYSGIGVGLYNTWYKKFPSSNFHLFNDNQEWLQMDKTGHAFTCYAEAVSGMNLMTYLGIPKKKAVWIGGMIGFGMQSIIELMDGFSVKWGFSLGDMAANVAGTTLAMSQQYYWEEQRVKLCYSFHSTNLSALRPELLGSDFLSRTLKDYNGQTSWLSINIQCWKPKSEFPAWLNIAIGYGGYGMLTGNATDNNIFYSKGVLKDYSMMKRYRKFYIAPDINLQKIAFIKRNATLLAIAKFLSPLKIPLPTLEVDKFGVNFKPFYF